MDVAHRQTRVAVKVSAVLFGAAIAIWQIWYPGHSFDRERWFDESLMVDGVRHRMAVRLLARDTLIGRTREEIVELLGPPVERDETDVLVYQLGPNRSPFPVPAMDSEWLSVILGADGRVLRCKLWED